MSTSPWGHVLVKNWPPGLRAFSEIVTHCCGAGGRKLIVWDEDKKKLVFSFQESARVQRTRLKTRRSTNDNSNTKIVLMIDRGLSQKYACRATLSNTNSTYRLCHQPALVQTCDKMVRHGARGEGGVASNKQGD